MSPGRGLIICELVKLHNNYLEGYRTRRMKELTPLVTFVPSPIGRVIALAVIEISVRSYVTPLLCLTPMLLRGTAAAAGIAFVNTLFSAGGFVGPNLMGMFKDATGSTSGAFLVLAVLSAGAGALCLVLRRQPAFRRSM